MPAHEWRSWPFPAGPPEIKAAFCAQQFALQTAITRHIMPMQRSLSSNAEVSQVGRLIVLRSRSRLHIVGISLLPTARGRGIGTHLIQGLIGEPGARAMSSVSVWRSAIVHAASMTVSVSTKLRTRSFTGAWTGVLHEAELAYSVGPDCSPNTGEDWV